MYYVTSYYTDEIIDMFDNFDAANEYCMKNLGSQVKTETDEILTANIELPF